LEQTWFRTREGRRYGWEIAAVIVVKLVLLTALWFVFIKPWAPPAAPHAIVQQLYLPPPPAARHD
jgi:cytoskeletal protein RodZ